MPPFRFAPLHAASTASSTASRGTQDASTPREIQSLSRPSATTPVCVIPRDHAGQQAKHPAATHRANQDQPKLSGIGGTPLGIAASDSAVWVTTQGTSGSELVTIDPTTNQVSGQPIPLPDSATDLAYLQGTLWVDISNNGGSVVSVDPATGQVSNVPESGIPGAAFDNSLWAPTWTGVDRIDAATNAVVAEIPLARVVQTAAGLNEVWALTATGSTSPTLYEPDQSRPATLVLLDPSTNSVAGTPVSVGISPAYMAVGDGAVWVAQYDSGIVTRVDLAG